MYCLLDSSQNVVLGSSTSGISSSSTTLTSSTAAAVSSGSVEKEQGTVGRWFSNANKKRILNRTQRSKGGSDQKQNEIKKDDSITVIQSQNVTDNNTNIRMKRKDDGDDKRKKKRIASLFDLYHSNNHKNETSQRISNNNDNDNDPIKKEMTTKKKKRVIKDHNSKENKILEKRDSKKSMIMIESDNSKIVSNSTNEMLGSKDVNNTSLHDEKNSTIDSMNNDDTDDKSFKKDNSTEPSSAEEKIMNPNVILFPPHNYQQRMPSSPHMISPYHSFYQSPPRTRRPTSTASPGGRKGISNRHSTANMLLSSLFGYPMDTTGAVTSVLSLLTRLALVSWLSHLGHNRHDAYSPNPSQHFMFERLNDRYNKDHIAMMKALHHNPPLRKRKIDFKRRRRQVQKSLSPEEKEQIKKNNVPLKEMYRSTIIVMNIKDDTPLEYLRDSVSFLLSQFHTMRADFGQQLEIVICLESPGGSVTKYGLAANQISRLTQNESDNINVTVCVDQIAASGGYMMACQASKGQLMAAPFAMVGSIGVYSESLNYHEVLKKYGVQPLLIKSGESKVPISMTSKVTQTGINQVQKKLEVTHKAFQSMVASSPRRINHDDASIAEKVTTGQVFFGQEALELGLIDQIQTSDEYIYSKIRSGHRVLKLHKYDKSLRSGLRLSPLDLLFLQLPKGLVKMIKTQLGTFQPLVLQAGGFLAACQILLKNNDQAVQARYYEEEKP